MAFVCNQKFAGKELTGTLHDILDPPGPGGHGEGGGQTQPNQGRRPQEVRDPLIDLAKQYEPLVRQLAERYLSQGQDPAQAWLRVKKDLAKYPNGAQLIDALERGELASALRLLPRVLYTDGAPVQR